MTMPTTSQATQPPADPAKPPTEQAPTNNPPAGANADVKFKQEDLDRIAGTSRKEGKNAGRTELLKELGFETPEAAKTAIEEANKLKKDQMTETERLKAEKAEAEKRATDTAAALAKAETERQAALLEAEIVSKASGKFANPKAVAKLLDLSKVKFENGQFTGVDEALTELGTKEPWTLVSKEKPATNLGPTNPKTGAQGRTDEQRRAEYFGGGDNAGFFKGGGVQIRDKKSKELADK